MYIYAYMRVCLYVYVYKGKYCTYMHMRYLQTCADVCAYVYICMCMFSYIVTRLARLALVHVVVPRWSLGENEISVTAIVFNPTQGQV